MGRVAQFIHYLNEEYEPTPLIKMTEYTHISFTERINNIGKAYRKERRKKTK
jgi:arsenate reductase-like glutaredoxin family protein